jgi:hypothetical protein
MKKPVVIALSIAGSVVLLFGVFGALYGFDKRVRNWVNGETSTSTPGDTNTPAGDIPKTSTSQTSSSSEPVSSTPIDSGSSSTSSEPAVASYSLEKDSIDVNLVNTGYGCCILNHLKIHKNGAYVEGIPFGYTFDKSQTHGYVTFGYNIDDKYKYIPTDADPYLKTNEMNGYATSGCNFDLTAVSYDTTNWGGTATLTVQFPDGNKDSIVFYLKK